MIAKVESGQKMDDVARQYGLSRSTVCTILAKKDIIKKTQAAEGVTKITSAKQRSAIHDKIRVSSTTNICDETGLFWKRMPNRTYITKDEKSVPGIRRWPSLHYYSEITVLN
ncbi:hypothetical protein TNCV_1554241 [Trichonephila clavipes]|nr:hypothetical protein TNCV_1554241 [Trichonephila clavipes]